MTLDALASWIEACIADSTPFLHNALPADIAELGRRYAFFKPCGTPDSIDCPTCEDPHPCPVRPKTARVFEYFCARTRWQPISRADIELVRFSRPDLVAAMATAAGCSRSRNADADLPAIRLGELNTPSGRKTWTLVYADNLTDPERLTSVIQSLKRMKPGGLVITPSRITPLLPLPKQFVLTPLKDVMRAEDGKLVFDINAAFDLLGEYRDAPSDPGRKSPIETEKALWRQYRHDAAWPQDCYAAQADFILARWPQHAQAPRPNARETIAGHISRHHQTWATEA